MATCATGSSLTLVCATTTIVMMWRWWWWWWWWCCVQECDQVHIDDVSSDDNGQDLRSDEHRNTSVCRASVAALGKGATEGRTAPGDTIQGSHANESLFCGWIYKDTGEMITWKAEEARVATMDVGQWLRKNITSWDKTGWHHHLPHRVTPTLVTPLLR